MTGPARHHLTAREVVLIDGLHHEYHLACRHLFWIAIVFPLDFFGAGAWMTIAAAEAERSRHEPHGPHELVDRDVLQRLHVFEDILDHHGPAFASSRCRALQRTRLLLFQ